MWRMLQQDEPDDYVVATAETHSVRDFARLAFQYAGLDYEKYVITDSQLYRPAEVDLLVGDPTKAHKRLGWSSTVSLESLVWEMVESDCRAMGIALEKRDLTAST
jgi:GDPmannose 4,6-dehydratase